MRVAAERGRPTAFRSAGTGAARARCEGPRGRVGRQPAAEPKPAARCDRRSPSCRTAPPPRPNPRRRPWRQGRTPAARRTGTSRPGRHAPHARTRTAAPRRRRAEPAHHEARHVPDRALPLASTSLPCLLGDTGQPRTPSPARDGRPAPAVPGSRRTCRPPRLRPPGVAPPPTGAGRPSARPSGCPAADQASPGRRRPHPGRQGRRARRTADRVRSARRCDPRKRRSGQAKVRPSWSPRRSCRSGRCSPGPSGRWPGPWSPWRPTGPSGCR